jgi:hypothetical protein
VKLNLVIGKQRRIGGVNEPDVEQLRKLPIGTLLPVQLKKPRSAANHRRFFALCQFIVDNHPRFDTVEQVLLELKIRAGHYDEHITQEGEVIFVPRSISYEEMEELDFGSFFQKSVHAVCTQLLPDVPRPVLSAYIERAAEFA